MPRAGCGGALNESFHRGPVGLMAILRRLFEVWTPCCRCVGRRGERVQVCLAVQDPLWQLVVFVGLAPSNRGVSGSSGNYLSGRWRLLQLHDELFISFPSLDPSDR